MSEQETANESRLSRADESQSGHRFFENLPPVLTMKECADLLQCSVRTLWKLVYAHDIPHKRVGRMVRFEKQQIRDWLRENKGA